MFWTDRRPFSDLPRSADILTALIFSCNRSWTKSGGTLRLAADSKKARGKMPRAIEICKPT